jgi:CheY-like chemotaxis protein/HPt (histidine-containing phosphotransfer) domain-containing protein
MNNVARRQVEAHVLIVDDDLIAQKIGQLLLEALGCRVDSAANGREALELLARQPYDLVFMDCEMPEMNGFEAAVAIRHRYRAHYIPIIALTATMWQYDWVRCLAAGMDDYVGKPVRKEELVEVLERWVPAAFPESLQKMNKSHLEVAPRPEVEGDQEVSALNWATLQRLRNLAQATEASLFARLLEKFQSDAIVHMTILRRAVATNDRANLRMAAHRFKGASLNLGAYDLGAICRRLENLDPDHTMDDATVLMAKLECEFNRVEAEIEQELNGPTCQAWE